MTVTPATLEPVATGGLSAPASRRLQRVAALLGVLAIVETIGILLESARGDVRFTVGFDLVTIGFVASVALFPVVGSLIVQRRPATKVAWLMIALGLGLGLSLLGFGFGILTMPAVPGTLPARYAGQPISLAALVISQLLFLPSLAGVATLLLLLFPTDRLVSPRWRLVVLLGGVGAVLYEVGLLLRPGDIDPTNIPGAANPIGAPAAFADVLATTHTLGNALVTASVVLAAVSLLVRYRRAELVEAAQIRWIAVIGLVATPAFAVGALQISGISDVGFGFGLATFACLPIAIGFAITRYRLYDIDRLINRALVYGALTATLAGIFTAGIGFAQRLFVATTGQTSDAAIVITTLIVATLYAPLRKRLEGVVDRRFKYEELRFGAYRDDIIRILGVVEPTRAAERLITEAVRELEATGGAVLGADERVTASVGTWPVRPVVRFGIPGGKGPIESIVIGPREDGRQHDPRVIAQLEEMSRLVASAALLRPPSDRQLPG